MGVLFFLCFPSQPCWYFTSCALLAMWRAGGAHPSLCGRARAVVKTLGRASGVLCVLLCFLVGYCGVWNGSELVLLITRPQGVMVSWCQCQVPPPAGGSCPRSRLGQGGTIPQQVQHPVRRSAPPPPFPRMHAGTHALLHTGAPSLLSTQADMQQTAAE